MYENIKTYSEGTIAYYLFLDASFYGIEETKNYILEKKYQDGAILACLSNILLAVKEDIVENEGELVYSSKVFDDALTESINLIATVEADGVRLDNYLFPDKETLVATIRNKIAHGDYDIDFNTDSVFLNVKGNKIKLEIKALSNFVISGFKSTIKDYKSSIYRRNNIRLDIRSDKDVATIEDIREILVCSRNNIFEIKNLNGAEVSKECRDLLEAFLKIYHEDPEKALNSRIYKEMVKHIKSKGHDFTRTEQKMQEEEISELIKNFIRRGIFDLEKPEERIEIIKMEIAKYYDENKPKFDIAFSYLKHLILIDTISRINSVDYDAIDKEMRANYGRLPISQYDFATSAINMFVSLYMYPFESCYMPTKEYHAEKKDLDFSKIDTSSFDVEIITINDNPLKEMKIRCDSCLKRYEELSELLEQSKKNLENVKNKGNKKAQDIIESKLEELERQLEAIKQDTSTTKQEYENMQKDYSGNFNFFRNQEIITGIRNSIAHGNYKIVVIDKPIIVFEDIYEGDVAFRASINIFNFYNFILASSKAVLGFVKRKEK